MTRILEKIKTESLKKRRRGSRYILLYRCILLYKRLTGTASIATDDLIPPIKHSSNHHSHVSQTLIARTDNWKGSLFPRAIKDLNTLSNTIFSLADGAEDGVAKCISLVRARD